MQGGIADLINVNNHRLTQKDMRRMVHQMLRIYSNSHEPSSNANTKPWEETVAPGLNKGYNNEGGIGFNTGMRLEKRGNQKQLTNCVLLLILKTQGSLSGIKVPNLNQGNGNGSNTRTY